MMDMGHFNFQLRLSEMSRKTSSKIGILFAASLDKGEIYSIVHCMYVQKELRQLKERQ